MRGKYKLAGMVAVLLAVVAAGALMLRLMDTPTEAIAENGTDEPAATIVNEEGETVPDTRTEADLEAMYQAGEPAFHGDNRYVEYVRQRDIETAYEVRTFAGKQYGVLENGETFGGPIPYIDEEGHNASFDTDYVTTFASDGAMVYLRQADEFNVEDINTPGEAAYAAAHPIEVKIPLYAKPGGEVYEYKTRIIGGPSMWSGYDAGELKYLDVTLVDGTQFEVLVQDYKDDPSMLDKYDVRYLIGNDRSLEVSGYVSPGRTFDYDTLDGTHLLLKLRDGSVVDIPIDDYYEDPSILDQYEGNIRDIIRTEKSLAEYEAEGVAEELFW